MTYDKNQISNALSALIDETLKKIEPATVALINSALEKENGELAKWAMEAIVKNAKTAEKDGCYACQDCGVAIVFAKVGRKANLECDLTDAINDGVRKGYRNARKSVACPLSRKNTQDNTPAIIYTEIVDGDKIELSFLAKGAGSENMSAVYMLTPSKGEDGIINSVVDCVKRAGANPCPPIILGVGIGGTMDKATILSKVALLRETGKESEDKAVAELEKKILNAVNETGIGAQGLGGNTTALAVHIETYPTHIGMLPVAVTLQCHAVRHGTIVL